MIDICCKAHPKGAAMPISCDLIDSEIFKLVLVSRGRLGQLIQHLMSVVVMRANIGVWL